MDPILEDAGSRYRPRQLGRLNRRVSTVGVEHLGLEDHFGRLIGELNREVKSCLVKSSLKRSILWPLEANSPLEQVIILEADRNGEV